MSTYIAVPVSGSGGTGSLSNPYKLGDLQSFDGTRYVPGAACTVLAPGDTLQFRGAPNYPSYSLLTSSGSTNWSYSLLQPTVSGTLAQPITLANYPGEVPVFDMTGQLSQQPVFGTTLPSVTVSFVRFVGLTIISSAAQGGYQMYINNTSNVEIAYCEQTMGYSTQNNYSCCFVRNAPYTFIHHNYFHNQPGSSGAYHGNGIEVYFMSTPGGRYEDNRMSGINNGMYWKNMAGNAPDLDMGWCCRSWFQGCSIPMWGNAYAPELTYHFYDNVLDGIMYLQTYNRGAEIHNNLSLGNYGSAGAIRQDTYSYKANIWNNIFSAGSGTYSGLWTANLPFSVGQTTDPVGYSDYNAYSGTPQFRFNQYGSPSTTFSLAQYQAQGFETHAVPFSTLTGLYQDTVNWRLKPAYQSGYGPYGECLGPRFPVAQIMNPSRYGPSAPRNVGTWFYTIP
jgi:hypothetical protein